MMITLFRSWSVARWHIEESQSTVYVIEHNQLWPTTKYNTQDVDVEEIRAQTMPVLDVQIPLLFARAIKL